MDQPLHHPQPGFADLLERAATWVLVATLAWGLLLVVAATVERLSHGRLPVLDWVRCPPALRPLLLGAAGLAVSLPGGAAHAADPLPVPTRPAGTSAPAPQAAPAPRPTAVVVAPGDSLWSLAQRRLGPAAADARVAALVDRTHRLNRAVVGPDPDLIHPGERLRFPDHHPTPSEAP